MGQVGIDLNLKPDPQQGLGFRVLVNVIWEQSRHLHLSDQMNVLEMMPELTAPAQLERPGQSFVASAGPKLKAQTLNSTAQNLRVLYCTERGKSRHHSEVSRLLLRQHPRTFRRRLTPRMLLVFKIYFEFLGVYRDVKGSQGYTANIGSICGLHAPQITQGIERGRFGGPNSWWFFRGDTSGPFFFFFFEKDIPGCSPSP